VPFESGIRSSSQGGVRRGEQTGAVRRSAVGTRALGVSDDGSREA
jgi:hypothetical protein